MTRRPWVVRGSMTWSSPGSNSSPRKQREGCPGGESPGPDSSNRLLGRTDQLQEAAEQSIRYPDTATNRRPPPSDELRPASRPTSVPPSAYKVRSWLAVTTSDPLAFAATNVGFSSSPVWCPFTVVSIL